MTGHLFFMEFNNPKPRYWKQPEYLKYIRCSYMLNEHIYWTSHADILNACFFWTCSKTSGWGTSCWSSLLRLIYDLWVRPLLKSPYYAKLFDEQQVWNLCHPCLVLKLNVFQLRHWQFYDQNRAKDVVQLGEELENSPKEGWSDKEYDLLGLGTTG